MSEVIVKLTNDYIKVKGGEYVADLVRCKDCKYKGKCTTMIVFGVLGEEIVDAHPVTYCSFGEVRDE